MFQRIVQLTIILVTLFPALAYGKDKLLRAGLASMITPVSTVKYYQQMVDYIGDKLELSIEMVHRTTYDEIDVMLEDNELDVAFICSSPYVLNNDKFGAELLVAPQVDGEAFYYSYIIVHKDSQIQTVEDLYGQTFAFVDPKSNTGKLYPTYLLAKKNLSPDSYFASYLFIHIVNRCF